jgi:hypothetical protein
VIPPLIDKENCLRRRYGKKTKQGKKRVTIQRREEKSEVYYLHFYTGGFATVSDRR